MENQLCSVCSRLDVAQYFRQEKNVQKDENGYARAARGSIPFKPLLEVYSTMKACNFCGLVLAALCRRYEPETWKTPDDFVKAHIKFGKDRVVYLFSYRCAEDFYRERNYPSSNGEHEGSAVKVCFRLGIGLRVPTDTFVPYIDHAGTIQLLNTSCQGLNLHPQFHGRLINPAKADLELARRWLKECENEHQSRCDKPSGIVNHTSVALHPLDLRIVDVQRMCLVTMPQRSRYVALSYRWAASAECFKTTTSNVDELHIVDSLKHIFQHLPATVQDAIGCTRKLGERYIWIDALCIIQDNNKDFMRYTSQMHRIYNNSLVTIIAAPSDGALCTQSNGLPGYRARSMHFPQNIARIQGLDLCTPYTSVSATILRAPWNTRAWTFQEELLSRRRLYFTTFQLFFQCSCGVFCEDTIGESRSPQAYIYPESSLSNLTCLYADEKGFNIRHQQLSYDKFTSTNEIMDTYANLVDIYTARHLSDQSDAIAALEGVLSVLSTTMDTEFVYGIPLCCFNQALLWMAREPNRRRTIVRDRRHTEPFPTWTWAGWQNYSNYLTGFSGYIRPEVDWFLIAKSGDVTQLPVREYWKPEDPESQSFNNTRHKSVRPTITFAELFVNGSKPFEQFKAEDLNSCSLGCPGSIACFQIRGNTVEMDEDDISNWCDFDNLVISDSEHKAVGSILMEKNWLHGCKQPSDFEFMLLSRSSWVDNTAELDETAFPMNDWCFINVMLVERHGNIVGRLGIGTIHENAWIAADPVPMLLQLR
jgi:hypothetical protein